MFRVRRDTLGLLITTVPEISRVNKVGGVVVCITYCVRTGVDDNDNDKFQVWESTVDELSLRVPVPYAHTETM
jgi:hypothetical protein